MKIAIVTDSTCDVPLAKLAELDVRVVPLRVCFGEETFLDQVEMGPEEFYDRMLASKDLPSTSQPSPADFEKVYSALADEGYEAIISLHIGTLLSGTYNSACLAAKTSFLPVEVIDTKSASVGFGIIVNDIVKARDAGDDFKTLVAKANELSEKSRLFFIPETIDNLVKGGRAGKAQGFAAGLLNIKLILTLSEAGAVEPFGKAKGTKGAITKLVDFLASEYEEHGKLHAYILQARNLAAVEALQAAIADRGIEIEYEGVEKVGPVIATHIAVGAIGIAFHPASVCARP